MLPKTCPNLKIYQSNRLLPLSFPITKLKKLPMKLKERKKIEISRLSCMYVWLF